MEKSLKNLIHIGGIALSSVEPVLNLKSFAFSNSIVEELIELLKHKNGFYAFESALHVFPAYSVGKELGLMEWNSSDLWICEYQGMADKSLFFAEDIFGGQFCIKSDGIYLFEPETGAFDFLAPDLEGWAQAVLSDYDLLTGYPLAHAWQQSRGILATGSRLVPKTPFVTGGEFVVENLMAIESVKAMRLRANLAIQIRDLPDGAAIVWKVTD